MNKTLLSGICCAATSLMALPAGAQVVVSGEVSPAIIFGGDVADAEIVDNNGTGSRVRFSSEHDAAGIQAFARYEIQIQENSSTGAVDGSESIDTRHAEVGLRGRFGTISLGKGDGASNETAEASYKISGSVLGGGHLATLTTVGTLNRDNVSQVGYTYYDGFSRTTRLRYDTHDYGGFSFSFSLDSADRTELAARYQSGVAGGKFLLLVGKANSSDGTNDRDMLSGGYRFNTGWSFAFSINSRTQDGGPDLKSQLYSFNYQSGRAVYSVDIGEQGVDGENEISQLGFEYHLLPNMDVYAGISKFENADNSSLDASYAGFRYKF